MADEPRFIKGRMDVTGVMGPVWVMGWLFTVGYVHLHLVKALIAIVAWPYYLGVFLAR